MSVIGVVLQVAYRLRRHFWLAWSLGRWLGFLIVAAGLVILIRRWPLFWPTLLLWGLCLVSTVFLGWAARRRHVHFEELPPTQVLPQSENPASPLATEELVPVRASGWFTVQGKRQYYMDIEADYETVGTGEHIVLGRVHPSRFLYLGQWPSDQLGWWYVFFQPNLIRDMSLGHLHFGTEPRPTIRVLYAPDTDEEKEEEEEEETIYLTSTDIPQLHRIWADLQHEAPPTGTGTAALEPTAENSRDRHAK